MQYWTECQEFFRQFRDQYTTTGSILPSSRRLARALTQPLRRAAKPRKILEIGPGTGAVTATLVRCLRPQDQLDIVEINGYFVQVLQKRFITDADFARVAGQARIIHAPLQEVDSSDAYDFLISGLPLNNFPLALVEEIFGCYQRLLKPGGVLSYFEYVAIRDIKIPLVRPEERDRLIKLSEFLKQKIRRYQVAEQVVLANFPPAVARHFCFQ